MQASTTSFDSGALREVFEATCPVGATVTYRSAKLTRMDFDPIGIPFWKVEVDGEHLDSIHSFSFKSKLELQYYLDVLISAYNDGEFDRAPDDLCVEPLWVTYF